MAKKSRKSKAEAASEGSHRKVIVFASLLGVMTLTSALLLALAPAPLAPGAVSSLFAVDAPQSLDSVFSTPVPVQPGRWNYIYVHHSQTDSGNAAALGETPAGLADHFVIGNGDGCGDGEVQIAQRWTRQSGAGRVVGLQSIDAGCISICLIGDFNRTRPTPTQVRRLAQLVSSLQQRCGIPASNVWLLPENASPAGVGKYFSDADFREQLLP